MNFIPRLRLDPLGRRIDYLRISVTDRCNERCLYCMPEGYKGWSQTRDHLSQREIVTAVDAACSIGFTKFRLTGGEPLIRKDIVEIARALKSINGVEELGISTNGTLLADLSEELKKAGVDSLNISLDTLDSFQYRQLTGGHLEKVVEGVMRSRSLGFKRLKLNFVMMKGVNESQIFSVMDLAESLDIPVCFIELMPLSGSGYITSKNFMSVGDVMKILLKRGELLPAPEVRIGNGPAQYYRFPTTGSLVGFIGAMTNVNFCHSCNKIRMTADGKLRPCLGRIGEVDIRSVLREGGDVVRAFQKAIEGKPLKHEFETCGGVKGRPMTAIGG